MHTISGPRRIPRFPGIRGSAALPALLMALPLYAADLAAYWLELARQRRGLERLDDRMLKDIGLSRADVELESSKPFWRS